MGLRLLPFLFAYLHVCYGCVQMTRYQDCVNQNTLKIMGCERLNMGDLYTYYDCLCTQNKGLYDCYSLCADDAILTLESQSAQINVQKICQQKDSYTPTTSSSSTTTTTTNLPATVAAVPKPSSSSTTTTTTTTRVSRPTSIIIMNNEAVGWKEPYHFCIIIFVLFVITQ